MLKKILIALLLLLLLFATAGWFLPTQYHVERSIKIERPASVVFTVLNGYQHFNQWSPWAELDPQAEFSQSGAEQGVGARMSWKGDPRLVGEGMQQIIESRPYELIRISLDFGEQGRAVSAYHLETHEGGTLLTWGFDTDVTEGQDALSAYLGRYFGLFLEQWVGADYEKGLTRLKRYVESIPETDFASADITVVEAQAVDILFVSGQSSQQSEDVAAALSQAFETLMRAVADNGLERAGQPMAISRGWDENGYRFEAAIPVNQFPEGEVEGVHTGHSPAGRAVRLIHTGPYDDMLASYERIESYMAAHGLQAGEPSWEHYISDPGNTPPEALITHIYYMLQD